MSKYKFYSLFLSIIFTLSISNLYGQTKTCSDLKGIWYYWLEGASEPILLNFILCEWKESGNPMGNRTGSAKYSTEKKKYEIIGFSDGESGPVYLTKASDYYYLTWISSWTNKPLYIVLSRKKYSSYYVDDIYQRLNAGGK